MVSRLERRHGQLPELLTVWKSLRLALLPATLCSKSPRPTPCAGDEVTALVFARDGLLYSGHISGAVRKWELPLASDSEDEDVEQAPAGVPLAEQQAEQQQQQAQQQPQQQQGAGQ